MLRGGRYNGGAVGTPFVAPDGTPSAPGYQFTGEAGTGGFYYADSVWNFSRSNVYQFDFNGAGIAFKPLGILGWRATGSGAGTLDTAIGRASANSLVFGTGLPTTTTTARTEMNKAVATIADAVATAVLTVTIPNAAHSASLRLRLVASLGAGGAIAANENTRSIGYDIDIARTAGVNAVAVIGTAYGGSAGAPVAGAATMTVTAAMSVVSGAVGATNTFTVNITITRGSGASTNHTCQVYAQLTNANATGVTIA